VAKSVPSLWYEVFGIVILESFTQKTPVIVNNRGGMPKVVTNSGGRFVFNTEAELIGAMDRLLNQPSLREQMGQLGYQTLKQKWSAEVHIPKYLRLIEQATASREHKNHWNGEAGRADNQPYESV
jgi:glycosyltransferase involved in cell wall biosynthesis